MKHILIAAGLAWGLALSTASAQEPAGRVAAVTPAEAGNNGVVIGSVEIRYRKPKTFLGELNEAFRGDTWTVEISREKRGEFSRLMTGGEKTFEVKEGAPWQFKRILPANTYEIFQMTTTAGGGTLNAPIGAHFRVVPNRTSYVGRLIVAIDARSWMSKVNVSVVDARDEDMQHVRELEPGLPLDSVVTDLMAAPGESLPPLEAAPTAGEAGVAETQAAAVAAPPPDADALAQGLLNSTYNLKAAEFVASMSERKLDMESHVTVDGKDFAITGANCAAFKAETEARVKWYRDAIASRGFVDLGGEWQTKASRTCGNLGFEEAATTIEQAGPEFRLSNGAHLRDELAMRGVVAEKSIAVEHSMDPTVILTGKSSGKSVTLTEVRTGCILELTRP